MSWLARSIANTLNLEEDDDNDQQHQDGNNTINNNNNNNNNNSNPGKAANQVSGSPSSSPSSPGRGVKEDLSEITKTLTRQLWGVASFLAPSPTSEPSHLSDSSNRQDPSSGSKHELETEPSDPDAVSGIRSDFAEIGGRFRSGISKLSSNIAVSEITKMASNLLQIGSDEEDSGYDSVRGAAVGVTDEVVAFVRDVAMYPETWLDFPLPEDEDEEDFDLSDAQQEHALAVERLAPRLAALRIELCPGYMSEGCFWKIYFVLLHPRLNRNDAELLSTPQIVNARALLTQELQNRSKTKPEKDCSKDFNSSPDEVHLSVLSSVQSETSESVPLQTAALNTIITSTPEADTEIEKHLVPRNEIKIVDKSVIEEGPSNQNTHQDLHSAASSRITEEKDDDGDDWLNEESSEIVGRSGSVIPIDNDEDVSFSDLEEDDGDVPTSYKKVTYSSDSSTKDSRDWVQLSRSSPDSAKDISSVSIEGIGAGQVNAHNTDTKESNDWLDVDDIDVA